jgi:hypothetical protein
MAFDFIHAMDLEVATIRRRNLLTALSAMSLASCSLKNPEAAIAEFSALVSECDKEMERLKNIMQAEECV